MNAWFAAMDQARRSLLVRLQTSHTPPTRMESYEQTHDLLRQHCPMVIVVVLLTMPSVQIYNMTGTGSERTDREDFLPGRTLSCHTCEPLPRGVHHHKLAVDGETFKKQCSFEALDFGSGTKRQ